MINPARILQATTRPGQPAAAFQALEDAAAVAAGHRWFTLVLAEGNDVVRIWSSRPGEWPVGERAAMRPTAWGAQVLTARQPFFGRDAAAVRLAFGDGAAAMGLGSAVSVPVVFDGAALGAMSLLHDEGHYHEHQIATLVAAAPLLVPGFLHARGLLPPPGRSRAPALAAGDA